MRLLVSLLAVMALAAALAHAQCQQVRLRKALNQLTPSEWAALNQGVRAMKANGALDRLTRRHRTGMQYHNTPHFFPMHRALMKDFEDELLKVAPTLTGAPYWDELREASGVRRTDVFTMARLGPMVRGPLQGVLAGLRDDFGRLVERNPANIPTGFSWAPPSEVLAQALMKRFSTYGDFAAAVEVSPHNQFHVAVGGHLANPAISPSDIAFWVHHSYIDLLWALWQSTRPQNYNNLFVPRLNSSLKPSDPVVVYPERWTNLDVVRYRTRLCYAYAMPSQRASRLKKRQANLNEAVIGADGTSLVTMGDVERHVRAAVASVVMGAPYTPDAPMGEVPGDAYVADKSQPGELAPGFDPQAPATVTAEDILRYTRAALEAVSAGGGFKPAQPVGEVGDSGWSAGDAGATVQQDGDAAAMIAAIIGAEAAADGNSTVPSMPAGSTNPAGLQAMLASATVDGLPIFEGTDMHAAITSKNDLDRHVRAAIRTLVDGVPYAPDAPPGDVAEWNMTRGAGVEVGGAAPGNQTATVPPQQAGKGGSTAAQAPGDKVQPGKATAGTASSHHGGKTHTTHSGSGSGSAASHRTGHVSSHSSNYTYTPPSRGSVASVEPAATYDLKQCTARGTKECACATKPFFEPLYRMPDELIRKVMPNMPLDHWRDIEEQLNSTIIELNGQISRGELDPETLPTVNTLLAQTGAALTPCQVGKSMPKTFADEDDGSDSLIPEVKAKAAAMSEKSVESSALMGARPGAAYAVAAVAAAVVGIVVA